MPDSSRRRTTTVVIILILVVLLVWLLARCNHPMKEKEIVAAQSVSTTPPSAISAPAAVTLRPDEVLTPAILEVPPEVVAGAAFDVKWTGPDNKEDFITIVPKDAADGAYTNYSETREGTPLKLTATMQPGEFEVRYVAGRSKKILGRAPIKIMPTTASLSAPDEVVLGSNVTVQWTGPRNQEDYISIASDGTPDGRYDSFSYLGKGSSVVVAAPVTAGPAELRYVSGQGGKVLARRPIKIKFPEVTLSAPMECISGTTITVVWTGPNNAGDYVTIVPKATVDGRYGNYTYTSAGAALKLLVPIEAGDAELRYMTGQGAKVLARKPIVIVAAKVSLSAPERARATTEIKIVWEGPNNPGDYITVVPAKTPDGQYAEYTYTTKGSPLTTNAPKEPGGAEVRYMTGQGGKVLARRSVIITAQ
jgi:Ca-activated chloride channel family protein